ncbi:DUF6252 family protein [Sungkyunkwania multivorans]|uniref:DUF6252 family protein n=1 Tax=Sungkyunkwania multivorans TaxID=1173618 RepID=A0ABW3D1K1_9FLAO
MKKYVFLILTILSFSCDDTEFNDPAFEATRNNSFWEASVFEATLGSNSSLRITAIASGQETIVLDIPSAAVNATYVLGPEQNSVAIYRIGGEASYTTADRGEGEIRITDISNNTVSGTFKFVAFQEGIDIPISFQNGNFIGVPINTNPSL